MSRRLVVAGSGEHARVVAEAAIAAGWDLVGRCGPAADPGEIGGRIPYLGSDDELAARLASTKVADRPLLILGFGGPSTARRRTVERFGAAASWATIVHPAAWVSPSAELGDGTVVLAGAVVNTGASIGTHAIVNSGAIVEHDVHLGSHVHVTPGAVVGGGAVIGDDTFIGLHASVRDHVTVGMGVTVAMGAAVVADVPDRTLVMGVPARG